MSVAVDVVDEQSRDERHDDGAPTASKVRSNDSRAPPGAAATALAILGEIQTPTHPF